MWNNLKFKKRKFLCFFCNSPIALSELKKVDIKLKEIQSEYQEFVLDCLPLSNNPREKPFIHKCDYGYNVLNICQKCFQKAYNDHLNLN